MQAVIDIIQNKEIVIVGPACHVQNQKNTIDQFDVVVRPNLCYPVPKKIQPHFGSRTDIAFAFAGVATNYLKTNSVLPNLVLVDPYRECPNKTLTLEWCKQKNINAFPWDWTFVTKNNPYNDIWKQINKFPTTGIHLINCMLNAEPKSITLIGYSFGITPHHARYPSVESKKCQNYKLEEWQAESRWHNFLLDLLLVKHFYQTNQIQVDDFLKNLFQRNLKRLVKNSSLAPFSHLLPVHAINS